MTKEQLKSAEELSNRVSAYSYIEKVLRGNGAVSMLHPEIVKQIGDDVEVLQSLTNDLLPIIAAKLEKAKQDFETL